VLWIGYLQWHFRTYAKTPPREPLLKDAHNIECRDAVLAWDAIELVTDDVGRPITRWDGRTLKPHPVTGELVPDERARVPVERYVNPRPAEWPTADFVVGNPPFIGSKRMREFLGDGYVDALQEAYPEVPKASDFVLRWWHKAADPLKAKRVLRFGFITTNSTGHAYNRRVLERHLGGASCPVSIAFTIPDHPWVDTADGAAVRISMTVAELGESNGIQRVVVEEFGPDQPHAEDLVKSLVAIEGKIHADLTVGANLTKAGPLRSNEGLCAVGFKTIGSAFQIDKQHAKVLGLNRVTGLDAHLRPYVNGRDLAGSRRGIYVIDLFGLDEPEVARRFPEVYQHLLLRAKPERIHNRNPIFRDLWWIIGHPRPVFRQFTRDLPRYLATIETSKHRFFVALPVNDAPDSTLVTFGLADGLQLGVLSSRIHVAWALRTGGTLEDRPRYNKTRCFETFPFPVPTATAAGAASRTGRTGPGTVDPDPDPDPDFESDTDSAVGGAMRTSDSVLRTSSSRIAKLAEQIDAHRKRQQALHPDLTLTGVYNVLERLRRIAHIPEESALSAKERQIHDQGLVSVLAQLHDELDAAVLAAYGWEDLIPALVGRPGGTTPYPDKPADQAAAEEELLTRLVALNRERAAEEARGLVRWLRPEFQSPSGTGTEQAGAEVAVATAEPAAAAKRPWPKTLPAQFQAVRDMLADQPAPTDAEQIARRFQRARTKQVAELLETLAALGQVQQPEPGRYAA